MAKKNKKSRDKGAATRGVHKLVLHLSRTGTGENKLVKAKEALETMPDDAFTEEAGAQHAVNHMRREGVGDVTLDKAQAFVDGGCVVIDPPTPGTVDNRYSNLGGYRRSVVPQSESALSPKPSKTVAAMEEIVDDADEDEEDEEEGGEEEVDEDAAGDELDALAEEDATAANARRKRKNKKNKTRRA